MKRYTFDLNDFLRGPKEDIRPPLDVGPLMLSIAEGLVTEKELQTYFDKVRQHHD